jgi:hypothetical protein
MLTVEERELVRELDAVHLFEWERGRGVAFTDLRAPATLVGG